MNISSSSSSSAEGSTDFPSDFSPPPFLVSLAFGIAGLELCLHPLIICVCLTNLAILLSTQILHPHLKFILLCQSVAIMGAETVRIAMVVQKFALADIFNPTSVTLQAIFMFDSVFRRSTGHLLFAERIAATILFKTYEHLNSKFCKFSSLIIMLLFSSANVIGRESWTLTAFNMITISFLTMLTLAEFVVICILEPQNRFLYNRLMLNGNHQTLSQKYQLTENIQTSKQLRPTFLCQIGISLFETTYGFAVVSLKMTAHWTSSFIAFSVIIISLMCAAIQITVIKHHPVLKRRSLQLMARNPLFVLLCRGKLRTAEVTSNMANKIHPLAVDSSSQPQLEMNEHFRMLKKAWETQPKAATATTTSSHRRN